MDKNLSIITINYNQAGGLKKTLDSLREQSFNDFELLLIDGGSDDGSVELVKKNKDMITYWISEKDNGIYDAQNKGILKAKGKYLLFLNSGDTLVNKLVLQDFNTFCNGNNFQLIYGDTLVFDESGKLQQQIVQPDPIEEYYFYNNTLNHQSCFIQKQLFDKFGLYKLEYKICSDFEFFLNVYMNQKEAYVHFNKFVANYSLGGISSDKKNYQKVVDEKEMILAKYFKPEKLKLFRKQFKKEMSFKINLKNWAYNNKIMNSVIKLYVHNIKGKKID